MQLTFLPLLFLFLFFFLIALILGFFILLQKGKGEGLAGLLGGAAASDGMGTPEAQKELSRWTAYLAGVFFAMCLMLTFLSSRCGGPAPIVDETPASLPLPSTPAESGLSSPETASPEGDATVTLDEVTPEATEPAPASPEIDVQDVLELLASVEAAAAPEAATPEAEAAVPAPEAPVTEEPATGELTSTAASPL